MENPKKLSDFVKIEPKNLKNSSPKITEPVNYPSYRSQKGEVSIPSEIDAEISKNWTEYNKL